MDSDTASIFAKSVRLYQFVDKDNSFRNGIVARPPPKARKPTLKNWKNTSKTKVEFKENLIIIPKIKMSHRIIADNKPSLYFLFLINIKDKHPTNPKEIPTRNPPKAIPIDFNGFL